jgi:hypothetical protein
VHAKNSQQRTALDRCTDADSEIALFLRPYMDQAQDVCTVHGTAKSSGSGQSIELSQF